MFRTFILTAALSLTALPLLAQESWSNGQIMTPYHQPLTPVRGYFDQDQVYRGDFDRDYGAGYAPTPVRSFAAHQPVYAAPQIHDTYRAPARVTGGPVIRDSGYQAARSQVRGGVVQYRAAEPGGTAFESGPGTETTVIQRGPDGVAVTVIYNP